MRTIEQVKSDIAALPRRDYNELLQWLSDRDWQQWDEQIQMDSDAGKLDFLIEEAVEEDRKGVLRSL